jgi:hypothetical protein
LKRLERINEFKHPELAYLKGGFLLGDWLSRAEQVDFPYFSQILYFSQSGGKAEVAPGGTESRPLFGPRWHVASTALRDGSGR